MTIIAAASHALAASEYRIGPSRDEVIVKLIPELKSLFTYQDYGKRPPIDGVVVQALRRFGDDGGSMTELSRFAGGVPAAFPGFTLAQINYSMLAAVR